MEVLAVGATINAKSKFSKTIILKDIRGNMDPPGSSAEIAKPTRKSYMVYFQPFRQTHLDICTYAPARTHVDIIINHMMLQRTILAASISLC